MKLNQLWFLDAMATRELRTRQTFARTQFLISVYSFQKLQTSKSRVNCKTVGLLTAEMMRGWSPPPDSSKPHGPPPPRVTVIFWVAMMQRVLSSRLGDVDCLLQQPPFYLGHKLPSSLLGLDRAWREAERRTLDGDCKGRLGTDKDRGSQITATFRECSYTNECLTY